MTEDEKRELRTKAEYCAFTEASGGDTEADYDELEIWVESKKKEWQELAVAEYKLKKEMETKFFQDSITSSEFGIITEDYFKRFITPSDVRKLLEENDLNIVITNHTDDDSNLTNAFEYNAAIIIFDVRKFGEKVTKRTKREKSKAIDGLVRNIFDIHLD